MLNTTGVFVNVPGDCFSFFKGFCWRIKDRGRFDASGTRRRCFKHTFVKERLNKCLLVSCSPPVAHVCVLVHLPPAGHRKMHRLDSWKPEFVRRVCIFTVQLLSEDSNRSRKLSLVFFLPQPVGSPRFQVNTTSSCLFWRGGEKNCRPSPRWNLLTRLKAAQGNKTPKWLFYQPERCFRFSSIFCHFRTTRLHLSSNFSK